MYPRFNQIPDIAVSSFKSGDEETFSLEGSVKLPVWAGFQSRLSVYNSINRNEHDGTTHIMVGEYASSVELLSVTSGHVNAYEFTLANQELVQQRILEGLLAYYTEYREDFGYEDEAFMPEVTDLAQFKDLIGLSRIHLMDVDKDGFAYVGYEFDCTWDEEHGLGVMTHKDRVIETGDAESSFNIWVAENDKDPKAAAAELELHKDAHPTRHKKPWWKFW